MKKFAGLLAFAALLSFTTGSFAFYGEEKKNEGGKLSDEKKPEGGKLVDEKKNEGGK
jgi:hypothetical protein